jgi:hypothetical protein
MMGIKDVLSAVPDEMFPAPVEGKCNAKMSGRDGFDRCHKAEGHRGSCVSYATQRRTADKNKAETEEARVERERSFLVNWPSASATS